MRKFFLILLILEMLIVAGCSNPDKKQSGAGKLVSPSQQAGGKPTTVVQTIGTVWIKFEEKGDEFVYYPGLIKAAFERHLAPLGIRIVEEGAPSDLILQGKIAIGVKATVERYGPDTFTYQGTCQWQLSRRKDRSLVDTGETRAEGIGIGKEAALSQMADNLVKILLPSIQRGIAQKR